MKGFKMHKNYLRDLLKSANEELTERLQDTDYDDTDLIHEIADSFIPVYTRDILQCAI